MSGMGVGRGREGRVDTGFLLTQRRVRRCCLDWTASELRYNKALKYFLSVATVDISSLAGRITLDTLPQLQPGTTEAATESPQVWLCSTELYEQKQALARCGLWLQTANLWRGDRDYNQNYFKAGIQHSFLGDFDFLFYTLLHWPKKYVFYDSKGRANKTVRYQ